MKKKTRRWLTADTVIMAGFWTQLALLFLVDWGTLLAFARQEVHWIHYIGFVVVNVVLLWVTWIMWGWMREQQRQ